MSYAQITVDDETYIRTGDAVARISEFCGNAADAKAVIAWLAGLDNMDRTAIVNAAGRVAKSFYEN